MATERLSPPVAPPAYEQSAWLDAHNPALEVEGDPETPEEFAAAYEFLQVATTYFQTDYGSVGV